MYRQRGNYGCESTCTPIAMNGKFNFLYFLYDHKNLITENTCTILTVYYALDLSVSFKAAYIDFTLVTDRYARLVGSFDFLRPSSIICSNRWCKKIIIIYLRAFVTVVSNYTWRWYRVPYA